VKPAFKLTAVFFRTEGGAEPVWEWLNLLPPGERKAIGQDIATVQYGWPLGMPLVRAMGDGLWEVRVQLQTRIAQVVFCVDDGRMVLLHGFIKKTQATPAEDLKLALARH
jgi:phage-related protein